MLEIRKEEPRDYDSVRIVNNLAFEQTAEGNIVNKLRMNCKDILSLVAISDDKIVGHIFFSPAIIKTGNNVLVGMGLAPMAVLPEYQNKGIGSKLVQEGLRQIRETECPFVIVLGHDKYYPRFGFEKASNHGLKPQWESVPNEAFMVIILDEAIMSGISGVATYRSEFDEAM